MTKHDDKNENNNDNKTTTIKRQKLKYSISKVTIIQFKKIQSIYLSIFLLFTSLEEIVFSNQMTIKMTLHTLLKCAHNKAIFVLFLTFQQHVNSSSIFVRFERFLKAFTYN